MAKKFTRPNVTRNDKLNDEFVNSFQKGDFIADEVYTTTDRDITDAYFKMLANTSNMGIYDSILIGIKKIEYSEEILQKEELGELSEKDIKRLGTGVFALPHPLMYNLYECIYIKTPISFSKAKVAEPGSEPSRRRKGAKKRDIGTNSSNRYQILQPKKAVEIINTIKVLDELRGEYTINPDVEQFLIDQYRKQNLDNLGDLRYDTTDLFIRDKRNENVIMKKNIFVPILKDNAYYEDNNGNKRYPFLSESNHYHRTKANQIKFHVKEVKKSIDTLVDTYFTTGKPRGWDKEIFVIRQYGINFFNPFTFLERGSAEKLYHRLIANQNIKIEVHVLIKDTYEHYLNDLDERENQFGNAIPTIEIVASSEKDLRLSKVEDAEEADINDILLEEDFAGEHIIEDPVEEAMNKAVKQARGFTTIDDTVVESIILGYNGKRIFGYYDHIIEYYIRVFVSSGSNKKTTRNSKSIVLETKDIPRPFQLVATINQNSDMFTTSGLTHPLDAFQCLAYKKYLYFTPNDKTKASDGVSDRERYLDYDEEYGLIDIITTKSEESSGLVSSILPYKHNADRFNFKK